MRVCHTIVIATATRWKVAPQEGHIMQLLLVPW